MSDEQQRRIEALEKEVADLRQQLWAGGPRLGPQPETPDEVARRTERLIDALKPVIVPPVDRANACTTSGEPVEKVRAEQTEPTGQHKSYIVLCAEERAKGFVRPYRDSYKHIGRLETLVDDEGHERTVRVGGCNTVTTMGRSLSETYARDPGFYGATFCYRCNRHLPVAEFAWTADGEQVGS